MYPLDQQIREQIIQDHLTRRLGEDASNEFPTRDSQEFQSGLSSQYNPVCGDRLSVHVRLSPQGLIHSISWQALGCAISQASCSMLTDTFTGQNPEFFRMAYQNFKSILSREKNTSPDEELLGDFIALTGISQFPARVKCALLGWIALEEAITTATSN